MEQPRYVPTNRVARFFRSMARQTAGTPRQKKPKPTPEEFLAKLNDEGRKAVGFFRHNVALLVGRWGESKSALCRKIKISNQTLNDWLNFGLKPGTKGKIDAFAKEFRVETASLWEKDLRPRAKESDVNLSDIVAIERRYKEFIESNPNHGKLAHLASTLDLLLGEK